MTTPQIGPLPVHGPELAPQLVVYRTRFTEDAIVDGEYGDADTTREVIVCVPDEIDMEDGLTAVDLAAQWLTDEGITEASTAPNPGPGDWFSYIDGSYIVDYRTGEREEVTAHPRGFSDDDVRALHIKVHGGRGY